MKPGQARLERIEQARERETLYKMFLITVGCFVILVGVVWVAGSALDRSLNAHNVAGCASNCGTYNNN